MMAVLPETHTAIPQSAYKQAFLAVVPTGRKNAITARELGVLMAYHVGHVVDERTVRQIASDLRRRGVLIASAISKPYGFYRPANLREAHECREQLTRRLREVRRTVAAYDRAVRMMEWRETVAVHPLPGMGEGA
jgi:hypothetical protein